MVLVVPVVPVDAELPTILCASTTRYVHLEFDLSLAAALTRTQSPNNRFIF